MAFPEFSELVEGSRNPNIIRSFNNVNLCSKTKNALQIVLEGAIAKESLEAFET